MYPTEALTRLALRKRGLQRKITRSRIQCTEAAAGASRPLVWLDQAMAYWRKLPPLVKFAVVPLGHLVTRTVFKRRRFLGSLMRWAPVVFGVLHRGSPSGRRAH